MGLAGVCVKHLNPRQGITTLVCTFWVYNKPNRACRVKHLNPRQGITTFLPKSRLSGFQGSVKHLNPRQGITTWVNVVGMYAEVLTRCVKHLNPRQGITTPSAPLGYLDAARPCETPKSPPGDYNLFGTVNVYYNTRRGVKHLNPRQGITTHQRCTFCSAPSMGVKHLNPRQGITTQQQGGRDHESHVFLM